MADCALVYTPKYSYMGEIPYMGENSLIENEATRTAGKRGDGATGTCRAEPIDLRPVSLK